MKVGVLVIIVLILTACAGLCLTNKSKDFFRNVLPLEVIDPLYYNNNNNPYNYYDNLAISNDYNVDLNCNQVSKRTLLQILKNVPDLDYVLHEYVYRYDPSINVSDPSYTQRALRMLLLNLPEGHPLYEKIRYVCGSMGVQVA